jgi:hypothetical protein
MPPKRNVKKPVKVVEPDSDDEYEYESIIRKLKFESSPAKHDDGRVQIQAKLIGDFVDSDLKKDLDILANDLQGSKLKGSKDGNITIGISCHYKGINKWTPALMRNINGEMQLWDASYDEKTADLYANDKIDAIVVFIIGGSNAITHLRGNGKKSNLDKRLFK